MNWFGLIAGTFGAWVLLSMGDRVNPFLPLLLGVLVGLLLDQRKRLKKLEAEVAVLAKVRSVVAGAPIAAPVPLKSEPEVELVAEPSPEPAPLAAPLPLPLSTPDPTPPPIAAAAPLPPRPTPPPPLPEEHLVAATSSLGASLIAWFRGGNTIVRVAVLILFIGVAFLLRYAAERTTVPLEWRLAGVALFGVALTFLGLRLTPKRRGYGLSLQGAGLGIVYLTLFAAFRLYALLPPGLAFGLLAAMAAITTVLSLKQDALPLAALGFGGAFLAPVLTSTGQGSHIALFSYYLLLNLAIAWIARAKAWKLLNVEGFVFTFGIGAAWGLSGYTPDKFWSTEPFLVANFVLYLFIAVQYTRNMIQAQQKISTPRLPLVDAGLLFATPIAAFGLQAAMLHEQPMGLAFSAAALAGTYLLLGQYLWRQGGQQMLLMVEGMVALGLVFLALVAPLALDARWTSAAWALQGLGVLWFALRQRRWWAAALGLVLQVAAAGSFWLVNESARYTPAMRGSWLFLNSGFLCVLLLSLAALAGAWLLQRLSSSESPKPAWLATPLPQAAMLAIGLLQLWAGGLFELHDWDQQRLDAPLLASLWTALLALACMRAEPLLKWRDLRWPALVLMQLALLQSAVAVLGGLDGADLGWARYTAGLGLVEAALLIALARWRSRRPELPADPAVPRAIERLSLAWYAMLQGGVFLYVLGAHAVARHDGWTPAAAILLPTLLALAVLTRGQPAHASQYRRGLLEPWAAALALWVLAVNGFCDASMAPLPYLPLLNPLDLAHGLVAVYGLRLARSAPWTAAQRRPLAAVAAALGFWWLNGLLVRTLHHWAGTPMWDAGALDSALVQTGLSVLWTLTALAAMRMATQRALRPVWIVGAALLGVVVLKLFLVDLSSLGSLERIVSFLAVGVLMLVIGYIAPLPPATGSSSTAKESST